MKIHAVTQGTDEWLRLRAGIPTASELDQLITPAGKLRGPKTEMPQTYVARKLAERWMGAPLQSFSGGVMEQGSILEEEAIPWLEAETKTDLQRPGFITTDDGTFGCSPDATAAHVAVTPSAEYLRGWTEGYEIKSPQPVNHVRWLLDGGCPADHLLQCQGGMFVTGSPVWMFVSYARAFPKLVVPVHRDETLMEVIVEAVAWCNDEIEKGWAVLCERNGGPPVRRPSRPVPVRESDPFAVVDKGEDFAF